MPLNLNKLPGGGHITWSHTGHRSSLQTWFQLSEASMKDMEAGTVGHPHAYLKATGTPLLCSQNGELSKAIKGSIPKDEPSSSCPSHSDYSHQNDHPLEVGCILVD